MVRIASLALLALFSAFAHASLSSEFQYKFSQALAVLADLQVKNLGIVRGESGDRLLPLARAVATPIRYVEVPSIQKPASATRRSAFSVCETNTVYINRAEFESGQVALPLVLHESLGALCVQDVGYEFSSILAHLVESEIDGYLTTQDRNRFYAHATQILNHPNKYKSLLIEKLASQAKIEVANSSAYIGGATYIGNAGDEVASVMRLELLKLYVRSLNSENQETYSELLQQAVFSTEVERVRTSKTNIRYVRLLGPNQHDEKFYFYVPESMGVDQAVKDMFAFLHVGLRDGANWRAEGSVPHVRN